MYSVARSSIQAQEEHNTKKSIYQLNHHWKLTRQYFYYDNINVKYLNGSCAKYMRQTDMAAKSYAHKPYLTVVVNYNLLRDLFNVSISDTLFW